MPRALRLALLLLLLAAPMPASFAGQTPSCWIVPGLAEHVQRWNAFLNRDPQPRRPG